MRYTKLETLVIDWAKEKGILEKGNPQAQAEKTLEEVQELLDAIAVDDKEEIADALGDILVTIIIQAEMQGMDLKKCLKGAYDIISKRKGKMVDGQFVKETPPSTASDGVSSVTAHVDFAIKNQTHT